jgi:hypothetical protein
MWTCTLNSSSSSEVLVVVMLQQQQQDLQSVQLLLQLLQHLDRRL